MLTLMMMMWTSEREDRSHRNEDHLHYSHHHHHYSHHHRHKITKNVVIAGIVTVILCFVANTARCQNVLVPSRLHVGENNSILLISGSSDSTAILEVRGKQVAHQHEPILSQSINFRKDQLVELPLRLATELFKDQHKITIVIHFERKNDEEDGKSKKWSVQEEFDLSPTNGFVFFQTDKPIYRANEAVRFRVLRLDRKLDPIDERVRLQIMNSQQVKVDDVKLDTKAPLHFAEYTFPFPLITKPGVWTAELNYGPKQKQSQKLWFDVTEYVLPKLRTQIIMPKYVLHTDSIVPISLNVTYTFGRIARGTVYFNYYVTINGNGNSGAQKVIPHGSSSAMTFGGNETFTFRAPLPFLRNYQQAPSSSVRLVVEATVMDCAMRVIEKARSTPTPIVRSPHTVSLRRTIFYYRKNVTNLISFEIIDPLSDPVPNLPINVTMTTMIDGKEALLHPYLVSVDTSTGSNSGYRTDAKGQVILRFNTYIDSVIRVVVRTLGRDSDPVTFEIKPIKDEQHNGGDDEDGKEAAFVWIAEKQNAPYRAGIDTFRSSIARSANLRSIYLIASSKGAIVYRSKLDDRASRLELPLTSRMVPSVRLLLLAFTASGRFVADSLRLDVRPDDCGVRVSIPDRFRRVFPGAEIAFSIAGRPGDVVGLQATDLAIYSLNGLKNSSLSHYRAALSKADNGCGAGAGADSFEAIRGAGFKLLSAAGGGDEQNSRFSEICKKAKTIRREKRATPPSASTSTPPPSDTSSNMDDQSLWCQFARLPAKSTAHKRISCEQQKKLILDRTQGCRRCAEEYFRCCKKYATRQIQHAPTVATRMLPSVSATSPGARRILSEASASSNEKNDDEHLEGDPDLIRIDFRDTWLFDLILLNESETTIRRVSPHSITTWAISSVSLSATHGFCLNSDHRVVTFKPFFMQIALPQSLVEHERTEIRVTLFNYLPRDYRLSITFDKVDGICANWHEGIYGIQQNLPIDAMSSTQISFPIVPLRAGLFRIVIRADNGQYTDTVVRNLTVLSPGIVREKQLTFDLDPWNRAKRSPRIENTIWSDRTELSADGVALQQTRVRLFTPNITIINGTNIVPNTFRPILMAVGDRFTPHISSLETLSGLIKKPKGCGEQNMYYMAFNLYTLRYLEQIDKLPASLRALGVGYLKRAYAQEMGFRKPDGSFSAFYKRESSIWLTAFVAKVLCQSGRHIGPEIDSRVIASALRWLRATQSEPGSWKERQPILHEKALGGVSGEVPLTAYVTIAFNECYDYLNKSGIRAEAKGHGNDAGGDDGVKQNEMADFRETIRKAYAFVLRDSGKLYRKDPYVKALIAYALTFDSHDRDNRDLINTVRAKLLNDLQKVAIRSDNKQFWCATKNGAGNHRSHHHNHNHNHNPNNNNDGGKTVAANCNGAYDYPVEIAGYALLAMVKTTSVGGKSRLLDYMPIVNWLVAQEKSGTFDNTQDTVVALEALTEFYARYRSSSTGDDGGNHKNGDQNGASKNRIELRTEVVQLQHQHSSGKGKRRETRDTFRFDDENADVMQTMAIERSTNELHLETRGNGVGKVQLLILYNEYDANAHCKFNLEITFTRYRVTTEDAVTITASTIDPDNFFTDATTFERVSEQLNKNVSQWPPPITDQNEEARNAQLVNWCSASSRLSKRSISSPIQGIRDFWSNLAASIKKGSNAPASTVKRSAAAAAGAAGTSAAAAGDDSNEVDYFPPLNLPIDVHNPVVMKFNACIRRNESDANEMVILEVSMLSGFRPAIDDLQHRKRKDNTFLQHYEVADSKVTFYLHKLPSARPYCIAFRVYQANPVSNLQAALVRVYNYYTQGWACTRLYSDDNVTRDDTCSGKYNRPNAANSSKCQCLINRKCPSVSVPLKESLTRHPKSGIGWSERYSQFRSINCTYDAAVTAIVQRIGHSAVNNYTLLHMQRLTVIGGDFPSPTFTVRLNPECAKVVPRVGESVIVMHKPNVEESLVNAWLLEGDSILLPLDAEYSESVSAFMEYYRKGRSFC